VGANTGFYSILLARLDPQRVVRAFEPFEPIADLGRGNLALAGVGNVSYELLAVGDHDGGAQLHVPGRVEDMIETRASLHDVTDALEVRPVPCARVDALAAGERVGLLKIDVEGAEPAVLAGAAQTLERDRPALTVEVLAGADAAVLNASVLAAGYVVLALRPGLQFDVRDHLRHDPASPNHLLLPRERLSEGAQVLRAAASEFAQLRRALMGEDPQRYLREQAARLPASVLLDQVGVCHRMLQCERAHVDRLAMELGALKELL
jgi:FkbM family methyltransferase